MMAPHGANRTRNVYRFDNAGRDMIKFILLLPLKIIGLLFIAIGAFLERREKARIAAAREYEKRIAAAQKEETITENEIAIHINKHIDFFKKRLNGIIIIPIPFCGFK